MSSASLDIPWQLLRDIARDWAGAAADLEEVKPLLGGYVNTTVALHCKDGGRAVLKITPHRVDHTHANEALQLAALRKAGARVPDVYRVVTGTLDHPFSYILMEFVDGVSLSDAKHCCEKSDYDGLQAELAEMVHQVHQITSEHYGKLTGAIPAAYKSWTDCYRALFDPIRAEIEKAGVLPPKAKKTVSRINDRLDLLLAHDDIPRLVHWDLWASNVIAAKNAAGRWHIAALIDPACRYAHFEAELAYMELFHTCNHAFMQEYQSGSRLTNEYHRRRKPIYQLYAMLNHLHCYGPEHARPTLDAIDRAAEVI